MSESVFGSECVRHCVCESEEGCARLMREKVLCTAILTALHFKVCVRERN